MRAAIAKSEAAAKLAASLAAAVSERQKALGDGERRLALFSQVARDLASLAEQGALIGPGAARPRSPRLRPASIGPAADESEVREVRRRA